MKSGALQEGRPQVAGKDPSGHLAVARIALHLI